MCGIAGIYLRQELKEHEELEKMVDTFLSQIEHRGRRATGIVAVGDGGHQVMLDKKPVNASTFIKVRKPLPEHTKIVLCHTRLDTQGSPENNVNNHPIVYRSVFMTHNGCIWNDDQLFADKEFQRNGEVDSEIIAALLAENTLANAAPALEALEGDFAIAAIDPVNEPGQLLLAKGAWSPLHTWENDFFIVWASTEYTIKKAIESLGVKPPETNDMYEFDPGEMWLINEEGIEKGTFISKTDDWESNQKKEAKKAAKNKKWVRYGSHDSDSTTGEGYWVKCETCFHHIPYKEARRDAVRGILCEDCDTLGLGKRTVTNDVPGDVLLITDNEKRVLETWTATDQELHYEVISELSVATGFSKSTVEWLVFRAPQGYLKVNKNMAELADYLDELYQEAIAKAWEKFNKVTTEAITDSEDSYSENSSDDDGVADYVEAIEKAELEAAIEMERAIDSCGVRVVKEDDDSNVLPFPNQKALQPGRKNDFSVFSAETEYDDCKVCHKTAEVQMGCYLWCNKHFDACNDTACPKNRGDAVGTDTDGRRLCHVCSRGVKGFLADSQLAVKGFEFKPVRV